MASKLKEKTAEEVGVHADRKVPISKCGKVGGNMVKKMIEAEEKKMIGK